MSATLNGCEHWHSYICDSLNNLNSFIMDLAPDARIGDVSEGCKIDVRYELATGSGQNDDLVCPILRDPVKGVHELGMVLRRENERPTVRMELDNQDSFGIS